MDDVHNSAKAIEESLEEIIATTARLFASEGNATEVAILVHAEPSIQQTDYDNFDGGVYIYTIYLVLPLHLYSQISSDIDKFSGNILDKIRKLAHPLFPNDWINRILISPQLSSGDNWRSNAKQWLQGEGINNQGRVRSDNVAPFSKDGLLFRSTPEINLYQAFKSLGVIFAPLPVFVKGGEKYHRIEPDFVLLKDGICMIVEVDGATVHNESPAEAHVRTKILSDEGVFIERIEAKSCCSSEKAKECALEIIKTIEKIKHNK